ncbi:MAG TPA: RNA 2',3'-cyclic phosphodiesterase [Verrucomicrobiae bacterium]|nr:RNA 2',3'-cyclic phosphodiesterase [Verrucomicrobiae bacterium]
MNTGRPPQQFRAFISLPVPEEVKVEIRRLQNELRTHLPDDAVRWTRPEQVHLTLKFLGNIPAKRVDELTAALREVCDGFAPIALRAEGVGFFPLRGIPRVLWVSVQDEREELSHLQQKIETVANRIIVAREEERFKGHLTIGRAKNLRSSQARKLMDLAKDFEGKSFGDGRAESVELMRSELGSDGSRYLCLAAIPLKG